MEFYILMFCSLHFFYCIVLCVLHSSVYHSIILHSALYYILVQSTAASLNEYSSTASSSKRPGTATGIALMMIDVDDGDDVDVDDLDVDHSDVVDDWKNISQNVQNIPRGSPST